MEDLNKLKSLITKPEHFEFFFKNLNRIDLFDWLNSEIKAFDHIPEPQLTDDGQYIFHPPWWPGEYLLKVADKIPDKVFGVIKRIKTENRPALDTCVRVVMKLPDDFIRKNYKAIITLFDAWLDLKNALRIDHEAVNLFKRYAEIECYPALLELLDVLSKTIKDKSGDVKFRFNSFYYKELADKQLPKLIEYDPLKVLEIIETHFKSLIRKGVKDDNSIDDYSTYWRSAIEESEEGWRDNAYNIFIDILRDTLKVIVKADPPKARAIIQSYLKEKYLVFRRLAIHTIRTENLDDLVEIVIGDETYLDNTRTYHEFFKLVQDKFGVLKIEQKKQFIIRIITNNFNDTVDLDKSDVFYTKFWRARRILMIKKYLEDDESLQEFKNLLSQYKDTFDKIKHPDLLAWSESWSGPISSLTKEQIASMPAEEFVSWIKNNLQPPYKPDAPSPEGVARIFKEVVASNPQSYATIAERFIDDKIWPAYLCELIRGFEDAIKNGKIFELAHIINLIENPLKFKDGPNVSDKHDEFDIGQYSWFRGAISDFIEELVKNDKFSLSTEYMNRTKAVLIELIEKDKNPDKDSEKKYGPEANNMDYVDYCINTNRGKAMRAFIQHTLRTARMRPEEERKQEQGKGPFPPGERMPLYEEFFTKRLDEEESPSVQSCYGSFLLNLFYLDKEWVKKMKKEGKLFPSDAKKIRYWEAHWEGYIGFNELYDELYDLLQEDYKKAVENLIKNDKTRKKHYRYNEHVVDHLMVAYWRQLEDIKSGSILALFLEKASANLRGEFIKSLSGAIKEVKPQKDSAEWKRLKVLWEQRIKKVRDTELGSFVYWLKYCPENLDDIDKLIEPIIPYLHKGYQEENLLEYLKDKVNTNPLNTLILLNKLLENEESVRNIYYHKDFIKEILAKSITHKDDANIVKEINKAVNRLGKVGYYEFREYLIE